MDQNEKESVKESFTICYLVLAGTALITFIEALKIKNVHARHILNLETAVSLTAGYVYGFFRELANKPDFDLKEIIHLRYIDWAITTPMLLLILILFLTFNSKKLSMSKYLIILVLNYTMLYAGYSGEKGTMDKRKSQIIGFSALILMLFMIYFCFLRKTSKVGPFIVFGIFSVIWSLYGVAAELDDVKKNKMYNVLDILSKAVFGLGLWIYYGGVAGI